MAKPTEGEAGETRRREADRVLDRVAGETDGFAGRVGRHFSAADKDGEDAAEVWGTRIGRGLALVFALVLIAGFFVAYL